MERIVTGVERRKLDRHAIARFRRVWPGTIADHIDCSLVGLEIARRIIMSARALAQHVKGETGRIFLAEHGRTTLESRLDIPAQHELFAHDPHGLKHRRPDDRLTTFPDEALNEPAHILQGVLWRTDDPAGQHEPPGGRIHQPAVGLA